LFEMEEDKQRVEQKMSGQTATPQLAAQSRYFLDEHYEDRKSPSSQDEAPFEGDPLEVFEVLANTLDPDLAEEYRSLGEDFALGYAYTNHGGFKTAIKYFEKALQSHPAQRMVHRELGRALVFQGEAKHAVKELKSAIEELPEDMELHHLLASATSESGEVDTALEILKEVQTKNPEEIETYLIMGDILLKAGDITRSGEAYQKALKMDPEFSETYSRLGAWAMARGEDTLAIEHYSEAVEHGDHLQDIVTLANLYLKEERDLEGALGLLNRALYYDPQRRWHYLVQIGEVYLKKGWDDKAREVLEGVREMIPEDRKDVLEKIDAFLGD
jgi:tetratricopeptide (TPR) repeat protein